MVRVFISPLYPEYDGEDSNITTLFNTHNYISTFCWNPQLLSRNHVKRQRLSVFRLIVADRDALLVVARGLIVGVDNGVRGNAIGVVRLSPGVDGVDICSPCK